MIDPVTPLLVAGVGWMTSNLLTRDAAVSVITNLASSQLFDPLCKRLKGAVIRASKGADGSLPRNHDVERAVRSAQLAANRMLVAAFAERAKRLNQPAATAFATSALDWIDGQIAVIATLTTSDAVLERMIAALDAPMANDADLETAARAAVLAALDELEAAVGAAPESFRLLFQNGEASCPRWFDAYGAFLAEQIKTNDRFRAILTAARLAELGTGVRRIENLLAEQEPVWTALRDKTNRILATLGRIEVKVDALKADTTIIRDHTAVLMEGQAALLEMLGPLMTERGAHESEIAALRRKIETLEASGALTTRAIETFLAAVGDTEMTPDQWPAQLTLYAQRYQDLLTELSRRSNLPVELEAERAKALAAAEFGDLHEAEAILAALTERFAAWRRDQQEMLDQAARNEASLLGNRAAIARTGLRYRDAADFYAQAAAVTPASDIEDRWRWLVRQASVLHDLGREFGDNAALGQAITLYRDHALQVAPRSRVPLDWAKTQTNLAGVLWTLGSRESATARLEEAVTASRQALEECTRERVPLDWAATQINLANALSTLGGRESGTERLEEAVTAYRKALEERTRERVPLDWAMAQNNLANTLTTLGERESGTARLEEAVIAYRQALEEYTRERVPLDWATTQNNLANALRTLGERESGTARLEEAVIAHRQALEERTRERVPLDWAMAQNNLANALLTLGEREGGTARLEEAVIAYRQALEEYTRERVPLDWAVIQNNLANALWALGERENGSARLEESVIAARQALKELTRERVPLDWAMTQNSLANALLTLGERESGTARLEEAVNAYRLALEERTRERVPFQWAQIVENLALAFEALFNKTGDQALLAQALGAARSALEVYETANSAYGVETCRVVINRLEAKQA